MTLTGYGWLLADGGVVHFTITTHGVCAAFLYSLKQSRFVRLLRPKMCFLFRRDPTGFPPVVKRWSRFSRTNSDDLLVSLQCFSVWRDSFVVSLYVVWRVDLNMAVEWVSLLNSDALLRLLLPHTHKRVTSDGREYGMTVNGACYVRILLPLAVLKRVCVPAVQASIKV